MYRNITYNVNKNKGWIGEVTLTTWNDKGYPISYTVEHQSYLYYKDTKGKAKSWFGDNIKIKRFKSVIDRYKWLKENPLVKVFECLSPVNEFLINTYTGTNDDMDEFMKYPLHTAFFDIEIAVEDVFPEPSEAKFPVNLITMYDNFTKSYIIWSLGEFKWEEDGDKVEKRIFNSEAALLRDFIITFVDGKYDIVSGWNCLAENESVWLKNRISKIQNVNKDNLLYRHGNVKNFVDTGRKLGYTLNTVHNQKIIGSGEHIFPVFTKDKEKYINLNPLLKSYSEKSLKELKNEIQYKDYYIKLIKRYNDNKSLSYRNLIIDNLNIFKEYKLFNFTIENVDFREFDDIEIIQYLKDNDYIDMTTYKKHHSKRLQINNEISNDILSLLGFIYTDGTLYISKDNIDTPYITFYNSNKEMFDIYKTIVVNELSNSNVNEGSYNYLSKKGSYHQKISFFTNEMNILLPLIYHKTYKKHLSKELLSQLSYNQFVSFYGGCIDGDGCIVNNLIQLANFEHTISDNKLIFQELLLWNGVYSRISKANVSISANQYTKNFFNDIHLYHSEKTDKIKKIMFHKINNSPSKQLNYFETKKYVVVKIKNIDVSENTFRMYDIETQTHLFYSSCGILTHNCFAFDVPYIINRASQLIDADIVNRLSATKIIKPKTFMFRTDGRYYSGYELPGLSQIDYMLIYKKYSKMLGGEKQSYKLEDVCQDELGYGKTNYEGNFKQLYQNDFDLFVKYNKQDVKLLVDLDKKLQYMNLTRMICNYSLLEYEGIYYTMGVVVNNLVQFGRKVKAHIPYRRKEKEIEHDQFTGAFVFPTHAGKYDKGIASFDVQSLYPNTMIALNISPEKKVGKILQGYGDRKIIKLKNGLTKELTEEQYNNFFENRPYSLASNGVIFETKTQGILPAFLEFFFNKRLGIKKEIKELLNLPKSKQTKKIKTYISELHSRQQTIKIILNSVYGTLGTPFSPYYDVDIAEAVTLSGQSVTRGAVDFVEQYFNVNYSQPIDVEPVVVAGDTDSTYLNLRYLTKKVINGNKITTDNLPIVDKEIEKVRHALNNWCENELSKKVFYAFKTNRLKFEREIISDVSYFLKRKHYICHLIDIEGQIPEEGKDFKYKGLAIVRSTYPKFAKDIMHRVFEDTIKKGMTESDYIDYLNEKYEEFKTLPMIDISTYQNVNTKSESDHFLVTNKGDTAGAKGVLVYNQLIERLKLKRKYDLIPVKMKVRQAFINPANIYGIDSLSFPDIWPEEFNELFSVDYRKQFEKIVVKPLDNFVECNRWCRWSPEMSETAVNIMDL